MIDKHKEEKILRSMENCGYIGYRGTIPAILSEFIEKPIDTLFMQHGEDNSNKLL